MYNGNKHRPKGFLLFPLVIVAGALLIGAVVMWLWNAVLPPVLNTKAITYWQAVGLLVLCRILFGSFGNRKGSGGPPFKKPYWKDKWSTMSHEEKIRFKEEWKNRCEKRQE